MLVVVLWLALACVQSSTLAIAEDIPSLPLNQAAIRLHNGGSRAVKLFFRLEECVTLHCTASELIPTIVQPGDTSGYVSATALYKIQLLVLPAANTSSAADAFATLSAFLGEQGAYTCTYDSNATSLALTVDKKAQWEHGASPMPVVHFLAVLIGCIVIISLYRYLYNRRRHNSGDEASLPLLDDECQASRRSSVISGIQSSDQAGGDQPQRWGSKAIVTGRSTSLDTFRGLVLAVYVFWYLGGGAYAFMRQSIWDGLGLADLGLPLFLFAMGLSITISFNKRICKGSPKPEIFRDILFRSSMLFVFGMVLGNASTPFPEWRVLGPLQRLAMVYLATAMVVMNIPLNCALLLESSPPPLALKGLRMDQVRERARTSLINRLKLQPHGRLAFLIRDIGPYSYEWWTILAFCFIHITITYGGELPNCPNQYIGPGGISDEGAHHACTGGIAGYIDQHAFGEARLCQTSGVQHWLHTKAFEPYGLLGTLNAFMNAYFGVQAGHTMLHFTGRNRHTSRTVRFVAWSVLLGIFSIALTGFSHYQGPVPINWNLWSISYMTITGCLSFGFFAVVYFVVEHRNWWGGNPLRQLGQNSLMVYTGSLLLRDYFPFNSFDVNKELLVTREQKLWHDVLGVVVWIIIALWFSWKGIRFSL